MSNIESTQKTDATSKDPLTPLKEGFERATDEIKTSFEESKAAGRSYAQSRWQESKHFADRYTRQVSQYVKKEPLHAAAIFAGVGFLIGKLHGRNK